MQKRRGIRALLLAAGVVLATVLGVRVASAAFAEAPYSLTVSLATDEFADDLAAAENKDAATVKLSLYLVAEGKEDESYETYNYSFADTSLQSRFDALQAGTSTESWQDFYDDVATDFEGAAVATGTLGERLEVDTPGIYLVLVEADDEGNGAYSNTHGYAFSPTMVALPGKAIDAETGVSTTAQSNGDWLSDMSIALKAEQVPLYGSLQIQKTVTGGVTGSPASFSFSLVGTQGGDEVWRYDGVMLTVGTGESTASTTVEHIPAGLTVSVSENDIDLDGFTLSSSANTSIEIVADELRGGDAPVATFVNEQSGPRPSGGHGIENLFTYDSESGDWVWTSAPNQQ